MASTINITQLVAEFGAYYQKNGQNMQRLRKLLYQPSITANYFRSMPTEDTIVQYSKSNLTRVLQSFQKAFTPIGDLTVRPTKIQLYNMKVDVEEYPDEIKASWLGFLEGNGHDRKDWPFIRWIIEEHIIPKMHEDHELFEAFKGVYAAPVAGVAGAQGASMHGINKIRKDYITAGRISPIATGALEADDQDFYEQVNAFVDGIPFLYKRILDAIFMDEAHELKYRRGARKAMNSQYLQQPNLQEVTDYPNIKVVGLPSMAGSDVIFSTPAYNRVRHTKKANLMDNMKVEEQKRAVQIMTDFWDSLNFLLPEEVFTNDQELV